MRRFILLLALLSIATTYAQKTPPPATFHRLLIYNEQSEVMVVKLKDSDLWVTPGIYQDGTKNVKQAIGSLAGTYGIKINGPELNGMFTLVRRNGNQAQLSIRNVFSVKKMEGEVKLPNSVTEIKWLPMADAIEQISFPHVKIMLKVVSENPGVVSAGTLSQYRKDGVWKSDILEKFYPLTRKAQ